MNALQSLMPQTKKPPGLDYYIPHYLNLIWRWKWYIFIVTPALFIGWTAFAFKFLASNPTLETSVTLQIARGSGGMRSDDPAMNLQMGSCDAFIRSRPFLQSIVEKLNLQLYVTKYFRSDIFDSISIDNSAPKGQYDFVVEKGGYTLFYTNEGLGIIKRVLTAGKLVELSSFVFPSATLVLTRDFVTNPHSMTFFISSSQAAIDRIQWNLSTKFPGIESQQGSIMVISLKGQDYPIVTQTLNAIADEFVARNTDINRSKKSDAMLTLEKQLQIAQSDLSNIESAIRQFREQNSSIGGNSMLGTSFSEVANLENSITSTQRAIDDALTLQSQCTSGSNLDDQIRAMFEAVTFLSTRQSVAAPSLQAEVTDAANEKRRVDADYSAQHPLVLENRKKIARVSSNVSMALSEVIGKMRTDVISATIKKSAISEEMQKLPAKELRFAELERKRGICAELYSSLQARYNISKMIGSSQNKDVVVLDHAVVPMPPGRLQTMSQLLLIGLAIALGLGLGPAAGLDFIDRRARNEGDCRRFSTLSFLEGIPVKTVKGQNQNTEKDKLDELLVSGSFEPDAFDEMYRSLRTKILLHLHTEAHKMLVVTSLNAGEGKSLTSSNLSIVMAQQKLRTLLIDGDMRRGVQHHSFQLEKKPGLSEILSSPEDFTTIPVNSFIQQTHIPNLSLLPCGMPIPNPAECMNSGKFRDFATILAEWFDIVILDTPPLRVAVDAAILPEAFKHYIIVTRAAKTNFDALEKKINDFPGLSQKVLGIVLNGAPIDRKMHNYTYSYYRH
jgi:capsular exopolysaccharide synthesis family protein